MIDVNILAKGNVARLISFECERLGLTCRISENPTDEAKLYVCDPEVTSADSLPTAKTLIIGKGDGAFIHSLEAPFLISDLRKELMSMLTEGEAREKAPAPKKGKKSLSLALNESTKSAKLRGNDISLSPTEFRILSLLLDRKGDVVTHDEINSLIEGERSNKANVYICFLRRKLESGGDKIIYSVRGKGFMIK
ncbi:MAG: winged helix-turn-helix transcriptional regulator [Clostridia bacterium]|nr:winged helix-turn-helix transcriptional regulator [Clostridia bacterium]